MNYKIIFRSEKVIFKDISKIPQQNRNVIFDKIDELSKEGTANSNTKKLNNYYLCDYRLRVGDYRILFNLNDDNNELIIFRILHRSKLY